MSQFGFDLATPNRPSLLSCFEDHRPKAIKIESHLLVRRNLKTYVSEFKLLFEPKADCQCMWLLVPEPTLDSQ